MGKFRGAMFHLNFQANEMKRKNKRDLKLGTLTNVHDSLKSLKISKEMGENFAKQAVLANLQHVRTTFSNPSLLIE